MSFNNLKENENSYKEKLYIMNNGIQKTQWSKM